MKRQESFIQLCGSVVKALYPGIAASVKFHAEDLISLATAASFILTFFYFY
jgi:hypothetical protein